VDKNEGSVSVMTPQEERKKKMEDEEGKQDLK